MFTQETALMISILVGVASLLTFGANIIIKVRKPNEDQDKNIIGLQKDMKQVKGDVFLMKENHMKHIEERMGEIGNRMTRIETILEERLPAKK